MKNRRIIVLALTLLALLLVARVALRRRSINNRASGLLKQCRAQPSFGLRCNCDMPRPPSSVFRPAFAIMVDEMEDREVGILMIIKVLMGAGVPSVDVFVVQKGTTVSSANIIVLPQSTHPREDYKFALDILFRCHPRDYSHVVVIDDYLELSSDAYSLLEHLVRLADERTFVFSLASINGFQATAYDAGQVRRTELFVPGAWAVSRSTYDRDIVPAWGELTEPDPLLAMGALPTDNTPWYLTMDAIMQQAGRLCVYPEVARAAVSSNFYEVSRPRGATDYTYNVRLHTGELLPPEQFGVMGRGGGLETLVEYDNFMREFVVSASVVTCVHEIGLAHRHHDIILPLNALDDGDDAWDVLLENEMGVQGRDPGRARPCGVYHGTVLVRWRSNLVLVVAAYSPMAAIPSLQPFFGDGPAHAACYAPEAQERQAFAADKGIKVVLGEPGEACSATCGVGSACDDSLMFLVNDCSMFDAHCALCVEERLGIWAPAYNPASRSCHHAAFERHLSCQALPPPDKQRLCPCSPRKQ